MAATLNFKFVANDKGLRDGINRSKKQLTGLQKTTKGVASGLKSALGGIGIGLGIAAVTRQLVEATKAAAADAKSQRLLALQLRTTTKASDEQIASTEEYIGKLSMATGIVDDDLRPAYAKAVRATGSLNKAQKLLNVALDGAAATGKPLTSVMDALTKAQNGNFTSLYRLAPQLKKTKGNVDDFARSVKGAKEASADPFARFQVATDNLNESLGTLLLPAVESLANWFTNDIAPAAQQFFDSLKDPNNKTGKYLKELGGTFKEIWTSLEQISKTKAFQVMTEFAQGFVIESFGQLADYMKIISAGFQVISGDTRGGLKTAIGTRAVQGGIKLGYKLLNVDSTKNSLLNTWRSGQMGTNTSGNIVINMNKSNMSPADMVRELQKYQRTTGKPILKK